MNDVRATPNPEVLQHRILYEQVALMCRLTTLPLFGSLFIGAILAYLAIEDSGVLISGAWYAACLVIMFIRWRVSHAFLQSPREHAEVLCWRAVMLALIIVFGSIWSIPAGFLLPLDPQRETIMSVVFIGATATGLASLASVRHAYAALLIPFTLPYGIQQLLQGGERIAIGVAFLLYLPVMIAIANRQTNSVERQIRLALENEALADALRRERDRVNDVNHELQVHLQQQRLSAERIRMLNGDLEMQTLALRTANDDLEGFAYSVSHDLRAPLRAIDGFSGLIQQEQSRLEPLKLDHYLNRIRENVARMSMLIDDLLAFSRYGRQPVDMSELHMEELARSAASEVRAAHASVTSPEIIVDALPFAYGDRRLLFQVWTNLLDNAVKYSSKVSQPQVRVSGHEEAERIVFEITDNGVGFDSRYSGSLFGVFHRLHAANEYPGTGVGLAIVQRIVKRHGGEVWARSELERGATFGFALPKPMAVAMALADDARRGATGTAAR
jgi:signal transduction histidine kinase